MNKNRYDINQDNLIQSLLSTTNTNTSNIATNTTLINTMLLHPSSGMVLFDDFVCSPTGSYTWQGSNTGTGSTALATTYGINVNHMGMIRLDAGTTTTGRYSLYMPTALCYLGNNTITYEANVYIPALSDGTDTFACWVGYGDNTGAGDHVDGIGFKYDSTVSANWRLYTSANSSTTYTTLGATGVVNVATWVKLGFVLNQSATRVDFYINGTNVGTHTTNIPSGASQLTAPMFKIEKSAGTNARNLVVDYFYNKTQFGVGR